MNSTLKLDEVAEENLEAAEERKKYENQIKELKKKHFFVENELEKKSNILLKLLEDNKSLKAKHDDFLSQTLKQIKSRESNLENFLNQSETGSQSFLINKNNSEEFSEAKENADNKTENSMRSSFTMRNSAFVKDKISLMNKSSNVMGKNLQKEIAEIKDEVSNSEFILKAKTQRIKELRIKLNNLNSAYDNIYARLMQSKSNYNTTAAFNNNHKNTYNNQSNILGDSVYYTNNNYNSNINSINNNLIPSTPRDLDKDTSMELNFLNKQNPNQRKNTYNYSKNVLNNLNNDYTNYSNINNLSNLYNTNNTVQNNKDKDKYSSELQQSNLICNISNFSDSSNLNITINNDKNEKGLEAFLPRNSGYDAQLRIKSKPIEQMSLQEVLDESENCVKIKRGIETSIKKLRQMLKEKEAQMNKLLDECEQGDELYRKLESEFGFLKSENIQSERKYKKILTFLESHEIFIKNSKAK